MIKIIYGLVLFLGAFGGAKASEDFEVIDPEEYGLQKSSFSSALSYDWTQFQDVLQALYGAQGSRNWVALQYFQNNEYSHIPFQGEDVVTPKGRERISGDIYGSALKLIITFSYSHDPQGIFGDSYTERLNVLFNKTIEKAMEGLNTFLTHPSRDVANTEILFCGYCIGGALAQMMAFHYGIKVNPGRQRGQLKVFSFGSPRWATPQEANLFNEEVIGQENHIRFVNFFDLIPTLPDSILGYEHTGTYIEIKPDHSLKNSIRDGLTKGFAPSNLSTSVAANTLFLSSSPVIAGGVAFISGMFTAATQVFSNATIEFHRWEDYSKDSQGVFPLLPGQTQALSLRDQKKQFIGQIVKATEPIRSAIGDVSSFIAEKGLTILEASANVASVVAGSIPNTDNHV